MLNEILAATRTRIADLNQSELTAQAREMETPRPFSDALAASGLAVVAEVKRRSPSRGELAPGLDPVAQARAYVEGGAAAISVLTDEEFFGGSIADLEAVRRAVDVPVLRKDFIIDPRQIWESRVAGADAVLLIVAALSDDLLAGLLAEASEAQLGTLVEVHYPAEAERALAAGASVIGVNNRDLATFEVDLEVARRLAPLLAGRAITIAESGISNPADAAAMAAAGYDAVLVGEALVTAAEPSELVASLRGASA